MSEPRPWWLDGDETCVICDAGYSYEVEIRCVDCDRPSCPHCIAIVRKHEPRCSECSERSDASKES